MLSDDAIDKLIQPIVDRQEYINMYVIKTIAKRIKEIGKLLPSDVYKLERLLKNGADVREINKVISQLTDLQVRQIQKIIKQVALDSYKDAEPYYNYKEKPYIPFDENKDLQRVVLAIANETANEYINLSRAQAFMIRDLKNPKVLKPTSISKTYYSVVDEAVQASQSGVIDYNTAMRRTIKQLVDSGIRRVEYDSESGRRYTQRLDTAVRRNLLSGIRAINQGVQDEVGKQFGADGKELSVHLNSAPDHEPIQGHQFTDEEYDKLQNNLPFKDVNGESFEPIERAIGIWNCRHFAFSIVIGVNKPVYNQARLNELIEKNREGYTLPSGKHLTLYECSQRQRQLETEIRYAKENQMAFKEAGNMDEAKVWNGKVNELLREYHSFCTDAKLKPQTDRYYVEGYKPLTAKEMSE